MSCWHPVIGQRPEPAAFDAIELKPADPVINDHLGDAYWRVGRTREAKFQWQRALTFEPEPDEVPLIQDKLARGLADAPPAPG